MSYKAFTALTDEICFALIRSVYSNNVKVGRDCSRVIYEIEKNVSLRLFHPVYLGILPNGIKEVLNEFPIEELNPEDMIITGTP